MVIFPNPDLNPKNPNPKCNPNHKNLILKLKIAVEQIQDMEKSPDFSK